ncbi:MAG TPA: metal-dependent hydrolase [Nanoarchaeota archaeon]|nr:metal-dependent hydrolase [Nanoarchaeota archaeon]
MTNAATHILVPLILADIYRDYIARKKFHLFYVLVAGIAGLFPDIDIAIYWILNLFSKVPIGAVHRQFTHTIFIPLAFLLVALLWKKNRKAALFFGMISFGIFTHLVLDVLFAGQIAPFYPFSQVPIGLNLLSMLGIEAGIFPTVLDGVLLAGWLIHEFVKHRIRDFI